MNAAIITALQDEIASTDAAIAWRQQDIADLTAVRARYTAALEQLQPLDVPAPPAPPAAPAAPAPKVPAVDAGRKHHKPTPARAARHTGGKPDFPAIALAINEARRIGRPVAPFLAAGFEVPLTTAKNWMLRCRALGLIDATATAKPIAPAFDPAPADTFDDIVGSGADPAGITPPPPPTIVDHDTPPPQTWYVCDDCGYKSRDGAAGRSDMQTHCDKVHKRRPSTLELIAGVLDQ